MKKGMNISRRSFLKAAAFSAAALSSLALTGCGSETAGSAAGTSAEGFKVGIVNYVDDASLNQIVSSLQARLDEIGAEKGVNFLYDDYYSNAQADQSNLNQIGADLVADGVDVIVAVATPTAVTMLNAVEDTDIPVIFSAVTDPAGAGFEGLDNITGTSDALDTQAIMNLILAANPALQSALGWLFNWKVAVLVVLLLLSVVVYRPFCRYLCPLGAIYGLFNPVALYRFRIDAQKCTHCGVCQRACPMDIPVHSAPNSPECIRCGKCKAACPHGAICSTLQRAHRAGGETA